MCYFISFFFFFNDTATTEIYTLSLHDALPIWNCEPMKRSFLGLAAAIVLGACAVSTQQEVQMGVQYSRSEEHTSELQSPCNLVCRLLLEKKKKTTRSIISQQTK